MIRNLAVPPKRYDQEALSEWVSLSIRQNMINLMPRLQAIGTWNIDHISATIKDFAKEHGIKLGEIAQPIRIALIGSTASPSVFHLLELLEKSEVLKRINQFLEFTVSLS